MATEVIGPRLLPAHCAGGDGQGAAHAHRRDDQLREPLLDERDHPAEQEEAEHDEQRGTVAVGHSTPFVDGTPVTRGSGAQASRSARATALNWASTMWCALRP